MERKFVIDEEISFVNEHDILKTQIYADSLVFLVYHVHLQMNMIY